MIHYIILVYLVRKMQSIKVNLAERSYEILIEPQILDQIGQLLSKLNLGKQTLIVSNSTVFSHYGERVINSLKQAGFIPTTCILPDGEQYKTIASVQQIYDIALTNRLERSSTMIALGGGVIGDMTGFAAATWLRGINFVQIPTSLLAMVDAAIGGKTGVNHPQGKNLIGAFYQPRLVVIDPLVLPTLPVREFRAGMAEVIKYGVIWDAKLFTQLEACERLDDLAYLDTNFIAEILRCSCKAKADVVSQDERESELRAILNYGHTIAHAVESLTEYKTVNHGEAVAIGMIAASKIAVALSFWDEKLDRRQLALIEKAQLPTKIPPELTDTKAFLESLQNDKKVKAGKVRFILPTNIGKVTITDNVSADLIHQILTSMMS